MAKMRRRRRAGQPDEPVRVHRRWEMVPARLSARRFNGSPQRVGRDRNLAGHLARERGGERHRPHLQQRAGELADDRLCFSCSNRASCSSVPGSTRCCRDAEGQRPHRTSARARAAGRSRAGTNSRSRLANGRRRRRPIRAAGPGVGGGRSGWRRSRSAWRPPSYSCGLPTRTASAPRAAAVMPLKSRRCCTASAAGACSQRGKLAIRVQALPADAFLIRLRDALPGPTSPRHAGGSRRPAKAKPPRAWRRARRRASCRVVCRSTRSHRAATTCTCGLLARPVTRADALDAPAVARAITPLTVGP